MKTHLSALASAISSLSLLTACGGGGGSGGPDAFVPSPLNPYVNVEAPATASAGEAFKIKWTAHNVTSCTTDFDSSTATANTISRIEATIGTYTYSVTCTGETGTSTDSVAVEVTPANAAGFWRGTRASDGSVLNGVVTKEGDLWLPYTRSSSDPTIVGFYAAETDSTPTNSTTGTLSSQNLRQVNFDTGTTRQGLITSANYVARDDISGSFAPTVGGSLSATGTVSVTTALPGLSSGSGNGTFNLNDSGTVTMAWSGQTTVLGSNVMNVAFSDVVTGNIVGSVFTGTGGHTHINSCSPASGSDFCASALNPQENTFTSVTGSINLTNGASSTFVAKYMSVGGEVTNTYNVSSLSVMISALPVITADAFTLGTYDNDYEITPALTDIAGNYTALSTGINATNNPGATFSLSSSGAITLGLDSASHCAFTALVSAHPTGGNVYDVTEITFTNSGGSCAYTGEVFAGVGIYDGTNKLTITALNQDRDMGFMIIATK